MARGFLGGALLGGAFSLGAALIAAIVVPLPEPVGQQPDVSESAAQTLEQPAPVDADAGTPSLAGDTVIGTVEGAPQVSVPERDTLSQISEEPPVPATPPVLADVKPLTDPEAGAQAGGLEVASEDPVLPNPQALAPMAPPPADEVVAETETAAPPVKTEPKEEAVSPEAEAEVATEPTVAEVAEEPQATSVEAAQTQTETPQSATAERATAEEQAPETPAQQTPAAEAPAETADAPAQPSFPSVNADAETPAESEIAEATPETPQDAEEEAPQVAMVAPSARPQIGTPASNLADRNTGVVVNRLGRSAQPSEDATNVTIITEEGGDGSIETLKPIRRYAAAFDNPDDKPLMSIVLIDAGEGPTTGEAGLAALRSFPYPLTFAVDSSLPDAKTRLALYRSAGFEVMAMVDLPAGAQATDAETTLGVVLAQLREVVGVLEGPDTGLQGSRAVSDQVSAILAQSGHGLVTQDKGLNTFPKLAVKEGVPASPVFRDFDSKGQTAVVIRRFLDQAAFKAGQGGAVIMLGRLRPDTISALLLWGLQDRAGTVALAPISAVLLREGG